MLNSVFDTKIVDFGLVRINENIFSQYSFVEDSLTRRIGTFAYMSPEMINEEEYDNKTDVYSFGVVLYFMFVGSLPKQNNEINLQVRKFYFLRHLLRYQNFVLTSFLNVCHLIQMITLHLKKF